MRIMNKPEEHKWLARIGEVAPTWPRIFFEAEARAEARECPRQPLRRTALKKGDRVSFDLGEGVEGPCYATNVRLIEPE
jgi:hypothetical protein